MLLNLKIIAAKGQKLGGLKELVRMIQDTKRRFGEQDYSLEEMEERKIYYGL